MIPTSFAMPTNSDTTRTPRWRQALGFGLTAALVAGAVALPTAAQAASVTYDTPGVVTTTVPSDACFVTATVLGGGGGNHMIGGDADNRGGSGAKITATYAVTPGATVELNVGSGGTGDVGGSPSGGAPGAALLSHGGAGGGGYSSLEIDGVLLILAGGGGGTGGGHPKHNRSLNYGQVGHGGDAGLPTSTGIFAGTNGGIGVDGEVVNSTFFGNSISAGTGGSANPGVGGQANAGAQSGQPGSGRQGGAGGFDQNKDAGGGGGAGWRGGGGGAATNADSVSGSGGGGGSSYVGGSPSSVSSVRGPATTIGSTDDFHANPGPDGSIVLNWDTTSCITAKNDSKLDQPHGVVKVKVLENDSAGYSSGTLRLRNGTTPVTTRTVVGEGVWTIEGAEVVFTPEAEFLGNPTPIDYQWSTTGGTVVSASVTVGYAPKANNDSKLNNPMGTPVVVTPLTNDIGGLVPSKTRLMNGGVASTSLTVTNEGTWTVGSTGQITFTPLATFTGDPSPVTYQVTDTYDKKATATVTVAYTPAAVPDVSAGNEPGDPVSIVVTANDHTSVTKSTITLLDPETGLPVGGQLVVPGEGTWTTTPLTGTVTFTPEPGFEGNPRVVGYQIEGPDGTLLTTTVTVAYKPLAEDDEKLLQPFGSAVTLELLGNDVGDLSAPTLQFAGTSTPGSALVVSGEGTWTLSGTSATFTPLATFNGNPTPVDYTVEDLWGYSAGATATVTYVPDARDDASAGHTAGDPVSVAVAANDFTSLDPTTVRLRDAGGNPVTTLTIPGEGEWVVDPLTGIVTFTPVPTLKGNPTPVPYEIRESPTSTPVTATVRVAYLPAALDDEKLLQPYGTPVVLDILGNDTGDFDLTTLQLGTAPVGADLVVPGEGTWSIGTDGRVTFTPLASFNGDPTPLDYAVEDLWGYGVTATMTVTYRPEARDDVDLGNVMGTAVTVDAAANDHTALDPATFRAFGPGGLSYTAGTSFTVAGEGTWTIAANGIVTFTPAPGFLLDPTPVRYEIEDAHGTVVSATITIGYLPEASNDTKLNNPFGQPVAVPNLLANDLGNFDRDSVRLVDAGGASMRSLVVAGEGTWTVTANAGVRFVPETGFTGDPTPVEYRVTDVTGDTVSALVTVTYLPGAVDDFARGDDGDPVTVNVLGNDHDALDPATVCILIGATCVGTFVAPGEGTWQVGSTGTITFTPDPGFVGNPGTVVYRASAPGKDPVTARVTVAYGPLAIDDVSNDNPFGSTVTVDVVTNDLGTLDPSSVRLLDGTVPVTTLVVPGEGVWTLGPDGAVRFTPQAGFTGDPSPVRYHVADAAAELTTATVTVRYLPTAVNDSKLKNAPGTAVTVVVAGNDHRALLPSTVRLLDALGNPLTVLVVDGQGTWRVNQDGSITFTPLSSFTGDPSPVRYEIADANGEYSAATVTVTYTSGLPITGVEPAGMLALALLLMGFGSPVFFGRRKPIR